MPVAFLNKLREDAFWYSLLFYVIFLPFSEALVSIAAGFLLFQSLALFSWKHPAAPHHSFFSLLMVVSVFVVYLVGITVTLDLPFAVYELKKVFFWIVIPVAFFISPRLPQKRFLSVLMLFTLSVLAASIFGLVRLIFMDYFHIEGFRNIILISHIRYSFQLNLAVIIAAWLLLSPQSEMRINHRRALILLIGWFMIFLILLKSITGIIAFAGTSAFFLIYLVTKIRRPLYRFFVLVSLASLITFPIVYTYRVWNDFYDSKPLDPSVVSEKTLSGNDYFFDFASKERENGHWVRAYICVEELRREWNRNSQFHYDSLNQHGYPYSAALIRYMTSKGLRKDSAGFSLLSLHDIKAVENGVANHIFVDRKYSLYPRIYETIWELDRYRNSGDPNFQSVSQRIEFFKASVLLIKQRPLLGIGTGNWRIRYEEAYREMNSKLIPQNQGPSHNQYINYLVKFGVIGLIYILTVLIIPVFKEGHKKNLLFWLFLISVAFANLGDANLETHMGLSFFCFFYCMFLWHTPEDFKISRFLKGHSDTM